MKKVYFVIPMELDFEGNVENLDLDDSKVFVNYDLAYNCLNSWVNDILSQDDELCCKQSNTEYIIERHTKTSYGDDFEIPYYKILIIEKEVED